MPSHPTRDEIRLLGNVKIIDRLSTITGEEGLYSPLTRIAVMERNVEIAAVFTNVYGVTARADEESPRTRSDVLGRDPCRAHGTDGF